MLSVWQVIAACHLTLEIEANGNAMEVIHWPLHQWTWIALPMASTSSLYDSAHETCVHDRVSMTIIHVSRLVTKVLDVANNFATDTVICTTTDTSTREIHPLEPQRHRHSMLAPRVCAPRVTRCSLGHVIWSVQLACSILSRSDSCQRDGRQRHLMMHGQCPIPVYSSQLQLIKDLTFHGLVASRWGLSLYALYAPNPVMPHILNAVKRSRSQCSPIESLNIF